MLSVGDVRTLVLLPEVAFVHRIAFGQRAIPVAEQFQRGSAIAARGDLGCMFHLRSLTFCWRMLQITAVTRFKGVATSEDFKSRDSISRKPSKAQQQPTPSAKRTLTGKPLCCKLFLTATACCRGRPNSMSVTAF